MSTFTRIERFALADIESAAIFWSILAAAAFSPLAGGRNTQLDLPSAFDAPAQGTTRLDLG